MLLQSIHRSQVRCAAEGVPSLVAIETVDSEKVCLLHSAHGLLHTVTGSFMHSVFLDKLSLKMSSCRFSLCCLQALSQFAWQEILSIPSLHRQRSYIALHCCTRFFLTAPTKVGPLHISTSLGLPAQKHTMHLCQDNSVSSILMPLLPCSWPTNWKML